MASHPRSRPFVWLAFLLAAPLGAQPPTGSVCEGTITDTQGQPLPGVTVTLQGAGPERTAVTDADGSFRLVGLPPGVASLQFQLDGFATTRYENVRLSAGRARTVDATLPVATGEEVLVSGASPLLDERAISTGSTLADTELEKLPVVRDVGAVAPQAPGVLSDRVMVGGNDTGLEARNSSLGANFDQSSFAVDGVVLTDMQGLGASPAFYDFDSFEEMQVTTGGSDATIATGGVLLNVVTKRGTNDWRGSARYLLTDGQEDFDVDSGDLAPGQSANEVPRHEVVDVLDFGAELGGPIVKDRLWIWGSYGQQETDARVSGFGFGALDDVTENETANLKLNAQLTGSNSATGFFHDGSHDKRGKGHGFERPQSTTWNQDGPTEIWKLEDSHVFSSGFYLTGILSYVNGGFQLVPQGGIQDNVAFDLDAGVWNNSFLLYQTDRPTEAARVDGANFFNTGSASHELKFGAGYRNAEVRSTTSWPGDGVIDFGTGIFTGFPDIGVVRPNGTVRTESEVDYTSAYLQDTLTLGNLTASVGVRYDLQEPRQGDASRSANPNFPGLVPGLSFPGGGPGFEWESVTPRLGLTYAVGKDRSTLLRASYSRFADQLGTGASELAPVNFPYGYFYFLDSDGDGGFDLGEPLGSSPFLTSTGRVPDLADPGLDPPTTDELLFGFEHEVRPGLALGGSVTYRLYSDLIDTLALVDDGGVVRPAAPGDYLQGIGSVLLDDGTTIFVPVFTLAPGLDFTGAKWFANGSREAEYLAASLTFEKRLREASALRGHLTYADWELDVPDSFAVFGDPNDFLGPDQNSGIGAHRSDFQNRSDVWIHGGWSFDVQGLHRFGLDRPWGFDVGVHLYGREGYPAPRAVEVRPPDGRTRQIQIGGFDDRNNDDVVLVDLRLQKDFELADRIGLTLSLDAFNLANESYVLQREAVLNGGRGGFVDEVTSPRIFRLGARLSFR